MSFEEQVKRLEEIVDTLESGNVPLDEVNKLFGEGVEITKNCFEILNQSKGKITVLQEELSKLIEKPLE